METRVSLGALILSLVAFLVLPGTIYSQSSPFKGKIVTLISGRGAGGTGDMRVRAIMPFLPKYIPGNPTILIKYMPGGGGRLVGNYLFSRARPDGLTIGNVGGALLTNGYLRTRGVRYDYDKFIYLGSANSKTNYVLAVSSKTGLDTLEKLQAATGLRIGSLGVGHDLYINARIFAWLMNLKEPRFVTGYTRGPEMDIALLSGEIDARINLPDTILQRSPEWITDKLTYFHAILEIPRGHRTRHPVFNPLPSLESFARNDREKKIIGMYRTFRLAGSPYFLPPGTPPDRVKILSEAFRKVYQDPGFLKEYKKLTGAEATPLMPEEQSKAILNLPTDPEMAQLYKKFAGAGPLPPH